jgi:hypothetical protein
MVIITRTMKEESGGERGCGCGKEVEVVRSNAAHKTGREEVYPHPLLAYIVITLDVDKVAKKFEIGGDLSLLLTPYTTR